MTEENSTATPTTQADAEKTASKFALRPRHKWMLGVVPAATLMLAASSQPLVDIYLPWEWTRNHDVAANTPADFALPVPSETVPGQEHKARVEIKGFQQARLEDLPGVEIPDGSVVWVILSQWNAPEESILKGCQMWATGDDGRRYAVSNSILGGGLLLDPNLDTAHACTPPDKEGPGLEWDMENYPDDPTKTMLDPGTPRPAEYKKLTLIVTPAGVTPQQWHIGWEEPQYVTMTLPQAQEFVQP